MTGLAGPAADEWAIRQLIEQYAGAVDGRNSHAAADLFIADGRLEMWLDPTKPEPTSRRHGRTEIVAALDLLDRFIATQHVIGNSVVTIDADRAAGTTQCTAHHVERDGDSYVDRALYLNYIDSFVRVDGRWRFTCRELRVRWTSSLPVESV